MKSPIYLSDAPWTPDFMVLEFQQKGHSVHLGVIPASMADALTDVPALENRSDWGEFAKDLVSRAIPEWQRPLDTERLSEIGTFWADEENFVVNPVVLAIKESWVSRKDGFRFEEVNVSPRLPFRVFKVSFGSWYVQSCADCHHREGGKWFDRCPKHGCHSAVERPLLIIDGQHRIRGSQQGPAPSTEITASHKKASDELIPISLLRSDRVLADFTQAQQAKIFTEITTKSVELDPAHKLYLLWRHYLAGSVDIWGGE